MGESRPAPSGGIFINYRRQDAAYPAGWLYDRLAERFGQDRVFKDVDSIELGDDFHTVITEAVARCEVLLAVIGPDWASIKDGAERRRLDDPNDFVRVEIEAALGRDVLLIPVLVEGAQMPRVDELPASMAPLVRRNALELSPNRFRADSGHLLDVIEEQLAERGSVDDQDRRTVNPAATSAAFPSVASGSRWASRRTIIGASLAGLMALTLAGWLLVRPSDSGQDQRATNGVVGAPSPAPRKNGPQVVALGGGSENQIRDTSAAFADAATRGFDFEAPARWSADGLDRTITSAFRVAAKSPRVKVYVLIDSSPSAAQIRQLVEAVDAVDISQRTIVVSPSSDVLAMLHERAKSAGSSIGLMRFVSGTRVPVDELASENLSGVVVDADISGEAYSKSINAKGMPVGFWLADTQAQREKASASWIDIIFTNRPMATEQWAREWFD
jgi:hypothetical protein